MACSYWNQTADPNLLEIRRDQNYVTRPAKCPFPECKFAIKGFPNPSDVKKHVRTAGHRFDIDELSSEDQARFDLIDNPPKCYPCLEEDCQRKYGQQDHLLRHLTTHHNRPKQRPGRHST